VNEQEMYVRVGELATRVGYPMPAIERTTDPKVPAVQLKEGAVGPTMVLRCHTEDLPPQVIDFLVTQDFVQARAGGLRNRWRFNLVGFGCAIVVWVAVLALTEWSTWTRLAVVLLASYLLNYLVVFVWRRRYLRWSDREVEGVLGGDAWWALNWLAESQSCPKNLRWLWYGAMPTPADRLRNVTLQTA
jgi:hypothetical protein